MRFSDDFVREVVNRTDLPSGLRDWLNSDPPRRIAVLLPLSNRLKSAGQTALEGIVEGLYATFRDPALRPDIITIDTEAAGSARAALVMFSNAICITMPPNTQ